MFDGIKNHNSHTPTMPLLNPEGQISPLVLVSSNHVSVIIRISILYKEMNSATSFATGRRLWTFKWPICMPPFLEVMMLVGVGLFGRMTTMTPV